MKKTLLAFLLISTSSLLTACGDSSDDFDSNGTYMGGIWRGNLTLEQNECRLDLAASINIANAVSQYDDSVVLDDETGRHYTGQLVGDDGFSVDALGPTDFRLPDGRHCNITYRYRYDSIKDDSDRTAEIRKFIIGACSDGSECQSEFAGDGMRD